MKNFKFLIIFAFIFFSIKSGISQCNQSMAINSYEVICNGNNTSLVTINVHILFGNGNNSTTISDNLGTGEVYAVVIEDNGGDVVGGTYMFEVPNCGVYPIILISLPNPSGGGSM